LLKKILDAVSSAAKPRGLELPLFPLSSVLFPGGVMPLKIFEQRYMDMTKACLKSHSLFGICLIREGAETGAPAIPQDVGTFARIQEWDMQQLGVLQVRAAGEGRFRIQEQRALDSGLIIAQVSPIAEDETPACPEFAPCREFLQKILAQIGNARFTGAARIDDPSWVSFRITEILPISQTIKQKMLELTDARMRLEILHKILREQKLIA
jgi:hypothetical protein